MKFDHTKLKFGPHIQDRVRTTLYLPVILLCIAHINDRDVIVGILNKPGRDVLTTWDLNGHSDWDSARDLVMTAPQEGEGLS